MEVAYSTRLQGIKECNLSEGREMLQLLEHDQMTELRISYTNRKGLKKVICDARGIRKLDVAKVSRQPKNERNERDEMSC